jgi:hypothetical protein
VKSKKKKKKKRRLFYLPAQMYGPDLSVLKVGSWSLSPLYVLMLLASHDYT